MTDSSVEIEVDALAAGGDGVGRDGNGRVTFIARGVPGDRLLVQLTRQKKTFARGVIDEVVRASEHRVDAPCEFFNVGECGGCQWQHIEHQTQLAGKLDFVKTALRHTGCDVDEVLSPTAPYGWRRRARFHWYRSPSASQARLGLFAPNSHFVADIDECAQLGAELAPALTVVREVLAPSLHGRGDIWMVAGVSGVHVSIDGRCNPKPAKALVGLGNIVGVLAGNRRFGEPNVELEGGLRVAGHEFAQASAQGNATLKQLVRDAIGETPGQVVELYAGSGNFTRDLAHVATSVVAVERSGHQPEIGGVRWVSASVEEAIVEMAEQSFDTVVLDPPRTGAAEVAAAVESWAPSRVVYVSCDPATLARDVATMTQSGRLRVARIQPVDLMPQTFHVETVVTLVATT